MNLSVDHMANAVDNRKGTDEPLPSSSKALDHQEYPNIPYQDHLDPWIPTPNAATMFQGAHGFYISGQPRFVNNFTVNEQSNPGGSRGFGNIAQFVSFEALHDSSVQDFDRDVDQGIHYLVTRTAEHLENGDSS
ncbi:hypothetical protein M378DRAFT_18573 [Amanita muscaria Koide BX008]|uniref:Uncharacterized protein n=1 Tax=Amanita muscaria (strain Koide BX008) TaxID=946122 RepID=A0A0C2W0W6_AMAMK|nr:hypothetical protein M378DRAFT_18573 [Amanita muscaria Koide BX008]